MKPSRPLAYAHRHRNRFVAELGRFLSFPSVSSEASQAGQVKTCAAWLAAHLKKIGLRQVRVIPTRGHPLVFAAWNHAPRRPTLLIYGHYDVLPGGSQSNWETQPFQPVVKGDSLFARGASDDKGQLFCHLKAIECYLRTYGRLPVNVKCLFEGEEEIGSAHLPAFIRRNHRALRADAVVISDTRMLGRDRPAISYAQRGGLRAELLVTGAPQELHSGSFGGVVHNPLQALCEMIASLHDRQGRIAIAGFYDDVQSLPASERSYMAANGPPNDAIMQDARIRWAWGEPGYSVYERTTARPSLTVSGITGGHHGDGVKSVIPTKALAKLSLRLVPDQDPRKIVQLLHTHIAHITPPTVKSTLRTSALITPALMDRNHPAMRTAALAYTKTFPQAPVFLRSGGSIPVVNIFQEVLQCPVVLMGFGLPDSNIHAPNENLHLPTFFRAIHACIWYQALFAGHRHQQHGPTAAMEEATV